MSALYYYAEKNNYLVAGTTNLTEFLLGFFVKYGDGGADIDPIRHLYKTQVYQLARYLKLPDVIIGRTPSPDTFSYPVSDEDFYFRLPYGKLDMLLYSFINKTPLARIKKSVRVNTEQLERIFFDLRSKFKIGKRLRSAPIGLKLSRTNIERKGHI
jgi:NAD+ synthase